MLMYTAEKRLKATLFALWVSTHSFTLSQRKVQDFENNQAYFDFNASDCRYRCALTVLLGFVQVCLTAPHSPRFK